ncbi:hypothetical protein WJX72_011240 [[Myrmecia] bisecta]|uniref:Uncharacterized protein n=1 Tax=[Myrmecia] bisecta TaxID=41462 RepID=A0AAW1PD64_9CHLO
MFGAGAENSDRFTSSPASPGLNDFGPSKKEAAFGGPPSSYSTGKENTERSSRTFERQTSQAEDITFAPPGTGAEGSEVDANTHWARAREATQAAEREAQLAERLSEGAIVKAEEASRAQAEAEAAHTRYDAAKARLAALEAQKQEMEAHSGVVQATRAELEEREAKHAKAIAVAEEAAALARTRYEEAASFAAEHERRKAALVDLQKQHELGNQQLKESEAQQAALADVYRKHKAAAEAANSAAIEKSKALASARALVEQKQRELAEAQRVAELTAASLLEQQTESKRLEEAALAKYDEHQKHMQVIETKRNRARATAEQLTALQGEFSGSQREVQVKAATANTERDRALEVKKQRDAEAAELEKARATHKEAETVYSRLRSFEAEIAQIETVRAEANENARLANAKYEEAQRAAKEWADTKQYAELHKAKWQEFWQQAKEHGNKGDEAANGRWVNMQAKLDRYNHDGVRRSANGPVGATRPAAN